MRDEDHTQELAKVSTRTAPAPSAFGERRLPRLLYSPDQLATSYKSIMHRYALPQLVPLP